VQHLPDALLASDLGHADLLTATNAETLARKTILNWIVAYL